MTSRTIPSHMRARLDSAARAAELLREAARQVESPNPEETDTERAARLRGAAILGHAASLEIAAAAGAVDALAYVDLPNDEGGVQ